MSLYAKPAGYKYAGLINGATRYRPFNNFLSGNMRYAPNRPTRMSLDFNFTGTPANGSQITVPDGPPNQPGGPNLKTFTFTYGASPGAGIIPLVGGGGTAAQAATAATAALAAQLTNWITSNPSAGHMTITANQRGVNSGPGLVGSTNITISTLVAVAFRQVLPGRIAGKVGGFFTDSTNTQS
jgi:hypothetical protein